MTLEAFINAKINRRWPLEPTVEAVEEEESGKGDALVKASTVKRVCDELCEGGGGRRGVCRGGGRELEACE